MTSILVPALEPSVQKTNAWLEEIAQEFEGDYNQAYQGLRAVLQAIRDRLPVEEASDLAAQLPLIIRGLYYEGWNPSNTPTKERNLASFLEKVAEKSGNSSLIDPETSARAVFKLLAVHFTDGQMNHVRDALPADVQELWPT